MTEPDLEAIRKRWESARAATIDNRETPNPEDPVGVSTKSVSAVWDSASDIPDLLELVKAVKLGWEYERERADHLEFELHMYKERIEFLERIIKGYQGQG